MNPPTPTFALNTFVGFGETLLLGSFLCCLFAVLALASWFWVYVWAWIDEATPKNGPMTMLLRKVWTNKKNEFLVSRGHEDDGIYIRTLATLFLLPPLVWFVLSFLTFVMGCATLVAMAYLTRYVRRLHKKFVKHVEDKDAHKG